MDKKETVFATGFFFEKKRDNAPEFVKGGISIKVAEAIELLKKYQNNAGYVRLDMLKSKEKGNIYFTVNTWQPEKKEETPELDDSSIPF